MKSFLDKDFLLDTGTARELFYEVADKTPILDYHCHINPQEIAEDKRYADISEIWLGGDHYKWRQLRWCGADEKYITGNAPAREKLQKFAEIMPLLIGNPIYHWSHLELQRYFGFDKPLSGETAQEVWDISLEKLKDMSARRFIETSGVTLICTTDDPADSLEYHKAIAADSTFKTQILPAWRPGGAMGIETPGFPAYIEKLGKVTGKNIDSFARLKDALAERMTFFAEMGCRTSDHSLDYVMYAPATDEEIEEIFKKALSGIRPTEEEKQKYLTAFMLFSGEEYSKLGWVMQLHYGVMRSPNKKMFRLVGPDTGFDAVSNYAPSSSLAGFLNALCEKDKLPKTVLYSLNPGDFSTMATIIGSFQDGSSPGKLQLGSAWWFYDTKTGMTDQLTTLANLGALGTFIGMLTDSRSFISYPRHEYFRRILCGLVGRWVENGEYPYEKTTLERLVRGICYDNAVKYFGFDLKI